MSVRVIASGSSNATMLIDRPCPRHEAFDPDGSPPDDQACEIVRIDHYGIPTPHLMCNTHGWPVGVITEAHSASGLTETETR